MIYRTFILLLVVSLCACQQVNPSSYIPDHNKDYLDSTVAAHLKVPMGFSKPQDLETYPMPSSLPDPSELTELNLEPPGFGKL